ncbi:MAG TPA: 4-hydroxybenzoate 3-monooxygenase [Actinomycetes bacterium]|nr:4-hydroxybenzoate 3-monooxygenase [Actinomycetes bacterium]
MRTQVAIIGSGPSGLLLSQILAKHGVESLIVENRSREYVEARIRAGVIEHGAVDVLTEYGVGDRLHKEGLRHDGIYLQWPGERHRVDFVDTCGHSVWVYGQTELTKDLINARQADGQQIFWEVSDTAIHDADTVHPRVSFVDSAGRAQTIEADYVAGCDGFHGVSRPSIPEDVRTVRERIYPFAWLGILAEVAPSTDELIYALHPDGFALHSMRSDTISRLYLQVPPDEDLAAWSDDRIWEGLSTRFALDGWTLRPGPIVDRSITPMRSFVSAPMRWGRLFLAGDASHIVPPTGAKGLNLAIADVKRLGTALTRAVQDGKDDLLDRYSDDALERVWQSTHFSWWMTSMLHTPPPDDPDRDFLLQMQLTQLRYVTTSRAAATGVAENYTGSVLAYP